MPDQLPKDRLKALHARELAAFVDARPASAALWARAKESLPDGVPMAWMVGLHRHPPLFCVGGSGSRFTDADGHSYVDFNLADLSNTVGYGENAVSRRIAAQALTGPQFLQPGEDAVWVAEELARRTGLPFWQFTVSASSANVEAIRIARAVTGRQRVVLFEGKYHGHIDTTMTEGGAPGDNEPARPEAMGLSAREAATAVNIPFNDLEALQRALAQGDVALVMAEPAMTNCALVLPEPGFLEEAGRLARQAGALFALDETHSWQMAYGGFVRAQGLTPDFMTLGKGLGSGAPLGVYGMTEPLARFLEGHRDDYLSETPGVAIGGTTYGNALTMAGARAMLEEVATEAGYARIAALGGRLAEGIDAILGRHGLPWRAFRYGPRSGICQTADFPRSYAEAAPSVDRPLSDALRLYMANRGVWEAIFSAGPQVGFAHGETDVDVYLEIAGAFFDEVFA